MINHISWNPMNKKPEYNGYYFILAENIHLSRPGLCRRNIRSKSLNLGFGFYNAHSDTWEIKKLFVMPHEKDLSNDKMVCWSDIEYFIKKKDFKVYNKIKIDNIPI